MCLYPKLVKNPRYKPNKKNGGNVPEMRDKRIGFVPVGCGECMECMKQKANTWKMRLLEEIKYNKTKGNFVTFTFSNEAYTKLKEEVKAEMPGIRGYDLDNQIATKAVHRFRERWRKHTKKSPRHWIITELGSGETEHLHMHGIIWTDDTENIAKRWMYGFVTIGDGKGRNYVNEETIGYMTKYVTKLDELHKYYKPKILTSPGIGKDFVSSHNAGKCAYKGAETETVYITNTGHKLNLNVYWRNKIYTEEERELLWLHKLDKGEQYIGGVKIRADDSATRAKLLKQFQKLNRKLGYGSPGDWEARKYEEERREMKQESRAISKESIIIRKGGLPGAPGLDDWIDFD